ncbi:unnamed protein product [Boreogadus saida]
MLELAAHCSHITQKPLHSTMTQLWPSPSHYGYDHHHHHPSGSSLTLYATAGRKTLDFVGRVFKIEN